MLKAKISIVKNIRFHVLILGLLIGMVLSSCVKQQIGDWIAEDQFTPLTHCEKNRRSLPQSLPSTSPFLAPKSWEEIKRVFVVVLENTDAKAAASQSFLSALGKRGAVLSDFHGVTHPSQPNYVTMIAGDALGVTSNANVEIKERQIGDLIREKGKKWKAYAEDYPGDCYLGKVSGDYARRHVPFLSFTHVSQDRVECANVAPATQLDQDIQANALADYSFYIPNNKNNGHDTGVDFADRWLSSRFGNLIKDEKFIKRTLFIVTFDESGGDSTNHIHTIVYGAGVRPGSVSNQCYDHFSLLATIEKILDLGSLGKRDSWATPIQDVWL